jgi:Acyl-CoA dehydrogenase, C-terminal domain
MVSPWKRRFACVIAEIAHICQNIVNTVDASCGAWANFDWHHVERHWRECNALAAHTACKFDVIGQVFGRAELGLPQALSNYV